MRITSDNNTKEEIVEGLLDSGASGKFIDSDYARDIRAEKKELKKPIRVYNVDGTPNKRGTITQYVDLNIEIHGQKCRHRFLVTGLGGLQIILGYPWLKEMNPSIDWQKGTLGWRKPISKKTLAEATIEWYTFVKSLLHEPKKTRSKPKIQLNKKPVTVVMEEDEEEQLNRTQNPLTEEDNKLGRLIHSITEDSDVWIMLKALDQQKFKRKSMKRRK